MQRQHHSGQKLRSATRWDQFVAILMSQLSCRQSLRDIQSNLESQAGKALSSWREENCAKHLSKTQRRTARQPVSAIVHTAASAL